MFRACLHIHILYVQKRCGMEKRESLYREYREDGVLLLSAAIEASPIDGNSAERDLAFLEEGIFPLLRDVFLKCEDPRKYIRTKAHHVRIAYTVIENGGECLSFLRTVTLFYGGKRLCTHETPYAVDPETYRALPPFRFLPRRVFRCARKRIGTYTGFLVFCDRLVFYRDKAAPVTVNRKEENPTK